MFVFGTKAVEQFVDRLIEWPQYCNHILQISHLRTSHMELVAFIEQALLKISAGHSDSDATSGNVEVATDFSNTYFVALCRLYLLTLKFKIMSWYSQEILTHATNDCFFS